ncbi:MAG: hypothetical protein QOI07_957 [Verrucomicrobiota bacterium]
MAADIEDAQRWAAAQSPSSQHRLLTEAIRQVVSSEANDADPIILLGIAQALLAGSASFFDEPRALDKFKEVMAFWAASESPEIKDQALTVAALLLNRLREGLTGITAETLSLMREGLNEGSRSQQSILSGMLGRIEAANQRRAQVESLSRRKFDVPQLDVPAAARNVREDIEGDWYQDPWGWPEIEWLGHSWQHVIDRLRSDLAGWSVPMDVSKAGGGVRPAMVINPLDRVAFQALVDELSVEAASHIPPWVHGWRLSRSRRSKGVYEANKTEWKLFSRRVAELCKQFRFTAHLDIQSFFPSVDTSRLLSQLGRRYRNGAVLDRLEAYFAEWHRSPNGSGIPQRSLASSVLAHAVLRPLDAFLDRKSGAGQSKSFLATRWMDDIWLHSDDELDLRTSVMELEIILAQSRLSLNSEKTAIFESKDAGRFVQLVDVYEEDEDDPNVTLSELLDRIERADDAPAFHVGLEVAKILSRKDYSSLAQIPSAGFSQFNYVADRLARAFRVSGQWRRFTDPYLDLARTRVSGENLPVAAWAEMFPNRPAEGVNKVQEFFSKNLVDTLQRLVTPLAAQRLAAWSSRFGLGNLPHIDLLQTFKHDNDVFRLRGIAFATLGVDALKDKVAAAAPQIDEDISGEFLRDTNFAAPPLSPRFQSE